MGIAPMKAQVYPDACGGHITKVIYQIKFLTTDISQIKFEQAHKLTLCDHELKWN